MYSNKEMAMSDKKYVSYEDFGAVGDGKTEDFEAIYRAHVYANENRLPIKARSGAKYYIHHTKIDGEVRSIPIKTDTDWTDVEFIIDDSDLDYSKDSDTKMCTSSIFAVLPEHPRLVLDGENSAELLKGLGSVGCSHGTKRLELGLDYPALVVIYNSNHQIYRRYGPYANSNNGKGQYSPEMELLVLDKDGNISPETPFMFDYPEITKIEVYRSDDEPVTVRGGLMKTIACDINIIYYDIAGKKRHFGYYERGLRVSRSHTVVDGVVHVIEGEISLERQLAGERGAHYSGFFLAATADTVVFQNCVLQGRRYYHVSGTYDFNGRLVNNIRLINCDQRNFWVDADGNPSPTDTGRLSMERVEVNGSWPNYCWGIGGTNFCKNMEYIGCRLSRFDAHQGLYNGKVIDSTVSAFELIGKGDFIVKNVSWYSYNANASTVLALRSDYGSTWDGNIYIDGFKLYASCDSLTLVPHVYKNWDFGYTCHIPSVEIKNVEIFYKDSRKPVPDGYPVRVYPTTMAAEPNMHLPETSVTPPLSIQWSDERGEYVFAPDESRGLSNDNPITPPAYVKIILDGSNDTTGKYSYQVLDTSMHGDGGFFGKTRFICGTDEAVGTASPCGIFDFIKPDNK